MDFPDVQFEAARVASGCPRSVDAICITDARFSSPQLRGDTGAEDHPNIEDHLRGIGSRDTSLKTWQQNAKSAGCSLGPLLAAWYFL